MQCINNLRRSIAAPLRQAQLALAQPSRARDVVLVLYQLLETFAVPKQLEQLCQEAVKANLLETVQVHQQIWDKVIQIFDQLVELLPDALLTPKNLR